MMRESQKYRNVEYLAAKIAEANLTSDARLAQSRYEANASFILGMSMAADNHSDVEEVVQRANRRAKELVGNRGVNS